MEEHYLKAACCLCAEMYGKGIRDVAINSHGKPVILKVEDVLLYLAEKIEEAQKPGACGCDKERRSDGLGI